MLHISLFSGIGGFDLASQWMGWTNIVSCEINPICRKVLEFYWPQAYHHDDIKTLTYEKINQELTKRFGAEWRADDIILSGGFPCQPYSMAGKRLGNQDSRHLWPEMYRTIQEIRPTYIVGENVRGLVNWDGGLVFDQVCTELEDIGYQIAPCIIPAVDINAPHKRERIFFIAYSDTTRCKNRPQQHRGQSASNGERINSIGRHSLGTTTDTDINGLQGRIQPERNDIQTRNRPKHSIEECLYSYEHSIQRFNWENFPIESPICNGDDGLSSRLDGITFSRWRIEAIKAAGNAVVPPLIYKIFQAIENTKNHF